MKRFFVQYNVILLLAISVGCQYIDEAARPTEQAAPNQQAAVINSRAGAEYINRGEYKIALQKLKKALSQDPKLPEAHNIIAVLYQRLKKIDKAEYHFKQALTLAPYYSEAQNNYGVFLCQQSRYKEAEQRFLTVISDPLYHKPAQAYENAGLCVDKIPNKSLAEKYFRTALTINPNLRQSLLKMADLSYHNIDYITAREYLERYHKVSSWTPQALLLAIKTEHKLGEQDKVASYVLLLKGEFPDSNEALEVRQGQY